MRRNPIFLTFVAAALLATLLPRATVAGKRTINLQTFTTTLFKSLGATPAECPYAVVGLDAGDRAVCAESTLEWRQLQSKTDSFIKKNAPDDLFRKVPWDLADGFHTRYVMTYDGPARLAFDSGAGWLAVVPSHPCFDSAKMERLEIHNAGCAGVSFPVVAERVRPVYPEAARIERAEGHVVIQAVVLGDGTVDDVCVLYESRGGVGFADAAVEAVSGYRFEPAKKNGKPVNTTFVTTLEWNLR